jgi:hypothetical protein
MEMTEAASLAPAPAKEAGLVWRKLGLVVWAIGFVPLFAALRGHLHLAPVYRCLIGTGILGATAVAAFWFLGRETRARLRAWRIFFVVRLMLLGPMMFTIVDGLAEQGWPTGKFNRPVVHVLLVAITMIVPTFLSALCALIRTYRLAGVLALVAGLASIVDGVLLLRASWRFSMRSQSLTSILNILGFTSKLESFLAIPMGIALVVGGIVVWRAASAISRREY